MLPPEPPEPPERTQGLERSSTPVAVLMSISEDSECSELAPPMPPKPPERLSEQSHVPSQHVASPKGYTFASPVVMRAGNMEAAGTATTPSCADDPVLRWIDAQVLALEPHWRVDNYTVHNIAAEHFAELIVRMSRRAWKVKIEYVGSAPTGRMSCVLNLSRLSRLSRT